MRQSKFHRDIHACNYCGKPLLVAESVIERTERIERIDENRETEAIVKKLQCKNCKKKEMDRNMNKQRTKEQLKKDIQELWNRHKVIIENIKTLRQSLEVQSTYLEYGATEIKLLEAELRELGD